MKRITAVIVGFIAGMILVSLGHMLSTINHPPPADLSIHDKEGLDTYIKSMPLTAYLFVVLSHFLASLIGSFVAARISDQYKFYFGLFVGALFVIATISSNLSLPRSPKFVILDIGLALVATYLGAKLGSQSRSIKNLE